MRLALDLGVKGLKISPLMPWGRAKHILSLCYPRPEDRVMLIKKALSAAENIGISLRSELYLDVGRPDDGIYGCPVVMGLTLLPNGDVVPCEIFAEGGLKRVVLGNLLVQDLDEIWNSPESKKIREFACVPNKPICKSCPYLNICGSYCIAEMYVGYGDLMPPREYFNRCKRAWRNPADVSGWASRKHH